MKNKRVVLASTFMELEKFLPHCMSDLNAAVTGIGLFKTAYNTQRYIELYEPETIIMIGIAGAYAESGLKVGDTVLVESETTADLGSFSENVFSPKFSEHYNCPYIPEKPLFPVVKSNSVNTAGTPLIERGNAQIENMEGAAFFYAATQAQIRFLELRAISNIVGQPFEKWNTELACENLAKSLMTLVKSLK